MKITPRERESRETLCIARQRNCPLSHPLPLSLSPTPLADVTGRVGLERERERTARREAMHASRAHALEPTALPPRSLPEAGTARGRFKPPQGREEEARGEELLGDRKRWQWGEERTRVVSSISLPLLLSLDCDDDKAES